MTYPGVGNVTAYDGYTDYEAVMTVDEAKALAARYEPHGAVFDHWKRQMKELDRKLANMVSPCSPFSSRSLQRSLFSLEPRGRSANSYR